MAYIAEDDPSTKGLWESIQKEIDDSDLFIADISSRSPNILLEVGYAIARKPKSRIGIFTAESIEIAVLTVGLTSKPLSRDRTLKLKTTDRFYSPLISIAIHIIKYFKALTVKAGR